VNSTDVVPPRPIFHPALPVIDFSQQKSSIPSPDGYSMTPSWGPRPQSDTIPQLTSSDENRVDDGDVVSLISAYHVRAQLTVSKRMDCETTPKRLASPSAPPLSSNNPVDSPSNPPDTEQVPLRTPKPLASCPSLEMGEISAPVPQGPTSQTVRPNPPKWSRFTMGPRSDCEKCRAGVKGHWGHFT